MMHFAHSSPSATEFTQSLSATLVDLHQNPYPAISNPPECKRRASVALIIRVRPSHSSEHSYIPSPSTHSLPHRLSTLLSQPWVASGVPEVLFIKRASRQGDRWTSHTAFPGGKRETGDADDRAAAIRECAEEVGLDLTAPWALSVGNLPERVITAEWGRTPLMVLCPFIFVLERFDIPPLRLQPSEVASAHWVPLRGLMVREWNCWERAEVSDRLSVARRSSIWRTIVKGALGQMLFAATRLRPTESVFSSESRGFWPEEDGGAGTGLGSKVRQAVHSVVVGDHAGSADRERPVILWGLTYGIVADFLDLLPDHDITKSWSWPTISLWDMRALIWLMTYRLRRQRAREVRPIITSPPIFIDEGLGTVDRRPDESTEDAAATMERDSRVQRSSAVGHMLDGYFPLFRRAVLVTLILRSAFGAGVAAMLVRRYHRG